MAIVKHTQKRTPQIRDYWPHYRQIAIVSTVVFSLVTTLVIGGALVMAGLPFEAPVYWLVLIIIFMVVTSLSIIGVDLLITPLRDIASAITSAAGEKPPHPLANPNAKMYAKTGFKPLLQFIYSGEDNAKPAEISPRSSTNTPLTTALNLINTGIVLMNAEGAITYANKAAPVFMDTSETLQLQLHFEESVGPAFIDWLKGCQKNAVHAQQTWERVPNVAVGVENRRIFNVTATYEKGGSAEVVIVAYDATNLFQVEDDDLDFIAFAAHELRGPITVIRGYLDSLNEELAGHIAPDQREILQRLIVSANRLSGYVNNILNASKFDHQHMQVHLARESISAIYQMIKDDMELRAQSQHRQLIVNLPDDLPEIAGDRSTLSEVLSNLIDNAIKYSHEDGTVTISAVREGDFVKISVSDTGIGIPQSVIDNLFHKFYRSHRSRETVAGTGIGLYICRIIVESHGGTIGVTSQEGKGSVFSFTVPTYDSVADKLLKNNSTNNGLITANTNWIKNHEKYTG